MNPVQTLLAAVLMCSTQIHGGITGWWPAKDGVCTPQQPTLYCSPHKQPDATGKVCEAVPAPIGNGG